MTGTLEEEKAPPGEGSPWRPRSRRRIPAVTVLLAVLLFGLSAWLCWDAAAGDLWLDEADYALAAVRGIAANRVDTAPGETPDSLIRLRHHHPPLVAQSLALAMRPGASERRLRAPSILAAAATVVIVYLVGLQLFSAQLPALACAVLLAFTPAHIRAGSHALPWAWITLWLPALLWALIGWGRSRRTEWLAAAGTVLGGLFVTSEYFFPALLLAAGSAVLWRPRRGEGVRAARRARAGAGLGLAGFLVIAGGLWPAGLCGEAAATFRYYADMAGTSAFPVTIAGQTYARAPKWAYAYWFASRYPGWSLWYAVGLGAALVLLLRRRLDPGAGMLLLFSVVVLGVAHGSHIIGPEYLVHALPFTTLLGGLAVHRAWKARRSAGTALLAALLTAIAVRPEGSPLAGMDGASHRSRWPAAAAFLAGRWRPGDLMLASQYGSVARWYVVHQARAPAAETDIAGLPPRDARGELLSGLAAGRYRWVAVGNSIADWTDVDNRIREMLRQWPVVWRSEEPAGARSRLLLYERPRWISPKHPEPVPPPPAPADEDPLWLIE